jgi:hypothetical protein
MKGLLLLGWRYRRNQNAVSRAHSWHTTKLTWGERQRKGEERDNKLDITCIDNVTLLHALTIKLKLEREGERLQERKIKLMLKGCTAWP